MNVENNVTFMKGSFNITSLSPSDQSGRSSLKPQKVGNNPDFLRKRVALFLKVIAIQLNEEGQFSLLSFPPCGLKVNQDKPGLSKRMQEGVYAGLDLLRH